MEDNNLESNVASNPEDYVNNKGDGRNEHISDEELNKIKQLQTKASYLALLSEKTYAEAKVSELEAINFTLTIYNKYKLISGKDSIANNGDIIRVNDTIIVPES